MYSTLACLPTQQELEANEEYVEREDEFDVNERPASPAANECAPAVASQPSCHTCCNHDRSAIGVATLLAVVWVFEVHTRSAAQMLTQQPHPVTGASVCAARGADASDTEVDIMALDPELRGLSSDDEGAANAGPGAHRPLTYLPVVIPPQADLVDPP